MATNWHNSDQLYIKFGPNEATPAVVGSYRSAGAIRGVVEIDLDLTTLTDTAAIINDTCKLPDGAIIESIETIALEAATGSSSVLDLGVIDEDRASNGNDDALIAAAPVADWGTVGNRVVYTQGSDEHGDLVGTILTKSLYITASYDTAAFDTGRLKLRINYTMTE